MPIKSLLDMCSCSVRWKNTQTYCEVSEEINLQLDVTYIFRKLIFLDDVIAKVMEEHEI